MKPLEFTLTLYSDAEPHSGLGSEYVNAFVTRDDLGRPVIRARHLKGLVRQELLDLASDGFISHEDVESVVGSAGWARGNFRKDHALDVSIRISDAKASKEIPVHHIPRTAIDDRGRARDTSLRVVEAIATGKQFNSKAWFPTPVSDRVWTLAKLALLSIRSIGGNRSRGSGACLIQIKNETCDIEMLLKTASQPETRGQVQTKRREVEQTTSKSATKIMWLRLNIEAHSPVVCPEYPSTFNLIRSGFAIPATAIQGALLHAINTINPSLADELFASPQFRCWPVLPVPDDHPCWPVRVALTHLSTKFVTAGNLAQAFVDESIEAVNLNGPSQLPMKATDGVLLQSPAKVLLWRSNDMRRQLTTHGVHNGTRPGGRDVFSVEAVDVRHWRGLACLTEAHADAVLSMFPERTLQIALGKSRGVHGHATMGIDEDGSCPFQFGRVGINTTLIAQSAVALPADGTKGSVQHRLRDAVIVWTKRHKLPDPEILWAISGINWGWNRHAAVGGTGRQNAVAVALPGAVIRLAGRADEDLLQRALAEGIGNQADLRRGFGALSPHPGKASDLYSLPRNLPNLGPTPELQRMAIERSVRLFNSLTGERWSLPSSSQIAGLLDKLASGIPAAIRYLDYQANVRPPSVKARWRGVYKEIKEWLVQGQELQARQSLALLRDFVAGSREDRR